MLLDSICKAGLNRARIHDALANIEEYDGVTGRMIFDPNQKNVAPLFLGTVHNGAITYRQATMEKNGPEHQAEATEPVTTPTQPSGDNPAQPYALVGEDGVGLAGPNNAGSALSSIPIVIFGENADARVSSKEMQAELEAARGQGQPVTLVPIESHQSWGAASTKLVQALTEEHAIAIIALDRDAAHLAEQLSLKMFIPVIALTDDKTLTSTNVPWIFRLPPNYGCTGALRILELAIGRGTAGSTDIRAIMASGSELSGISFQKNGEPLIY
jgi:hypothetical protein